MTYFDTTRLAAPSLADARKKAAKQDDTVLDVLRALGRPASPEEVLEASGLRCPLTSIRRSMTTLTKAGLLEKTDLQRPGSFGRPTFLWQIAAPQLSLFH